MIEEEKTDDMEYFALVATGVKKSQTYGLLRMENGDFPVEQFDRHELIWKRKNAAAKYFMGHDNDAEPVTKEQADELVAAWRKEGSPFVD